MASIAGKMRVSKQPENHEHNMAHEDVEEESSDNNEDEDEAVDAETRDEIRKELKQMSLSEIQRLKNKLGLKAFNESLNGSKKIKGGTSKPVFKRENKNRPREMGTKRQVGRFRDVVGVASQVNKASAVHKQRDPRFDAACGDFDEKTFKSTYKFVDDLKAKERGELAKKLKREKNEERREQLRYLIQRYDNQEREKRRLGRRRAIVEEHEAHNRELLRQGKRPVHVSKEELRQQEMAEHFEELSGRKGALDKYIKRKTKKMNAKERKVMEKQTM